MTKCQRRHNGHFRSLRVVGLSKVTTLKVEEMEELFKEIKTSSNVRCYAECPMYINPNCSSLGREVFPGLPCEAQKVSRGERK